MRKVHSPISHSDDPKPRRAPRRQKHSPRRTRLPSESVSNLPLNCRSLTQSLLSGSMRPRLTPPRSREVFVGADLECRLFDEPLAEAPLLSFWSPSLAPVGLRSPSVTGIDLFGRTPQLNLSHTDECRQRGQQSPSSESWTTAPNANSSTFAMSHSSPNIQVLCETQNTASSVRADLFRNVRYGCKVVSGVTNGGKSVCAVRVVFVDRALLSKMCKLIGVPDAGGNRATSEAQEETTNTPHQSLTEAQSNTSTSVFAAVAAEEVQSEEPEPPSHLESPPVKDPQCQRQQQQQQQQQQQSMEYLPGGFFLLLQKKLEHIFFAPSCNSSVDIPSMADLRGEESAFWLCSPSSALRKQKRTDEPASLDTSLRRKNESVCGGAGNSAPLALHASGSSSADSSSLPLRTPPDSMKSATHTARGRETMRPFAVFSAECNMPIIAVSVFHLTGVGEEASPPSVAVAEALTTSNMSATMLGGRMNTSLPPNWPSPTPTIPLDTSLRQTLASKRNTLPQTASQVAAGLEEKSTSPHSLRRRSTTAAGTDTAPIAAFADASVVGHAKKKKSPEKQNNSKLPTESLEWDALSLSPEVGSFGVSLAQQSSTKNEPLFAIALCMPFVRHGSLQNVFFDWIRERRPSVVHREMIIRNIIYAVLQHLANLHRSGYVHGSIKATNIFVTPSVLEALNDLSSKNAAAAAAILRTTLSNSAGTGSGGGGGGGGGGSGSLGDVCGGGVAAGGGGGGNAGGSRKMGSRMRSPAFSQVFSPSGFATASFCATRDDTEEESSCSTSRISHGNLFDQVDWSKHILLSDGYYSLLEAVLLSTLEETMETIDTAAPTPVKQNELDSASCGSLRSSLRMLLRPPPLLLSSLQKPYPFLMEELQLFTPEELSYVPPPECITMESEREGSNNVDEEESSHPQPSHSSSLPPFRKTSNTRNPRPLLLPSYDVWMVGMLAIHLADGGLPSWVKRQNRPLPRLRPGTWSVKFASFVQRCAAADPMQRPSVEELLNDKWFHSSLLDDSHPETHSISPRHVQLPQHSHHHPHQHQQQQQQQPQHGAPNPASRRPCRRAFIDILLEYHEYAEEWTSRFTQINQTPEAPRRPSVSTSSMLAKEALGGSLSGVAPPNLTMTVRRDPEMTHAFTSDSPRGPHSTSQSNSSDNDSDSTGSRSSGHSLLSGSTRENLSGTRNRSGGNGRLNANRVGSRSKTRRRVRVNELDHSNNHEEDILLPPSFLGAFSVALETCFGEATDDAEDNFYGTNSFVSASLRRTEESSEAATDLLSSAMTRLGAGSDVSHRGHHEEVASMREEQRQELMGQLLQAFWNLHRECRLAADVWCMSLMKHMLLDGRTAESVAPILSEETRVFFAPHSPTAEVTTRGSQMAPVVHAPPPQGGGTSMGQQQQQQVVVDVSPTAFHNYMFGKWCVTTSWALQQKKSKSERRRK